MLTINRSSRCEKRKTGNGLIRGTMRSLGQGDPRRIHANRLEEKRQADSVGFLNNTIPGGKKAKFKVGELILVGEL